MPESPSRRFISKVPKSPREYLKCIEKFYYSRILEQSYQNSDIRRELLQNIFTKDQSKSIYDEIRKRVKKLGPCQE